MSGRLAGTVPVPKKRGAEEVMCQGKDPGIYPYIYIYIYTYILKRTFINTVISATMLEKILKLRENFIIFTAAH